jgi:hypothetical protein
MSLFTWYDNHNLDYGGVALRDIDWTVPHISETVAASHACNENTIVWHRRRNRTDLEAMSLYRFLDHTVAMDTDR